MSASRLIGIDLGGTKCAIGTVDAAGQVREVVRFPTAGPEETLDRLRVELQALQLPSDVIFGVSCGGPLDAPAGLILDPPNLPGWHAVPITRWLSREFGGRANLMNDASAGALAEWQTGAGRGCRHLVFLTMGTGLGAGLILNGRLYEGASGQAGEIGHVRLAADGPLGHGKAGSFEGFCSGSGIAQLATASTGRATDARALAAAAQAGDADALRLWAEVGARLGQGLAWLIDVLNPERIILGSIFRRCERFLAPALQATLHRECLPANLAACAVVPSAWGDDIGCHAALAVARHHLTP